MSYPIRQTLISQNRSCESLSPIGAVLHSTADEGITAAHEYIRFNSRYLGASAHAFVDWSEILQTIPWREVAWGSGRTSNHRFLQIELCEPYGYDLSKFKQVWGNAVDLFAQLFIDVLKQKVVTKYNLLSHAEISAKWHETDHTDPIAYFAKYGRTVDDFREAVQGRINIYLNVVREIVYIDNPKDSTTENVKIL